MRSCYTLRRIEMERLRDQISRGSQNPWPKSRGTQRARTHTSSHGAQRRLARMAMGCASVREQIQQRSIPLPRRSRNVMEIRTKCDGFFNPRYLRSLVAPATIPTGAFAPRRFERVLLASGGPYSSRREACSVRCGRCRARGRPHRPGVVRHICERSLILVSLLPSTKLMRDPNKTP
jgi:hypothetical protein